MTEKAQTKSGRKGSLAAAPPEYLPDIAWFLRMAQADQFAIADDLRFNHPSAVNRASIKSAEGQQWLTVPVKADRKRSPLICEARIDNRTNWRRKHWRTLQVNYAYAPYFDYFADFFSALYQRQWEFLIDINLEIISYLKDVLRITTPLLKTSDLDLPVDIKAKTLALLKATDSRLYLTDPATEKFLRSPLFDKADIVIQATEKIKLTYRQQFGGFIPNLSLIDLLFNEGPESIWLLARQISRENAAKDS